MRRQRSKQKAGSWTPQRLQGWKESGRAHSDKGSAKTKRPKTPSLLKGKSHASDSQGANQQAEGRGLWPHPLPLLQAGPSPAEAERKKVPKKTDRGCLGIKDGDGIF